MSRWVSYLSPPNNWWWKIWISFWLEIGILEGSWGTPCFLSLDWESYYLSKPIATWVSSASFLSVLVSLMETDDVLSLVIEWGALACFLFLMPLFFFLHTRFFPLYVSVISVLFVLYWWFHLCFYFADYLLHLVLSTCLFYCTFGLQCLFISIFYLL